MYIYMHVCISVSVYIYVYMYAVCVSCHYVSDSHTHSQFILSALLVTSSLVSMYNHWTHVIMCNGVHCVDWLRAEFICCLVRFLSVINYTPLWVLLCTN